MAKEKNESKDNGFGDKLRCAYLRHVKKRMYCPACKSKKMAFSKKPLNGSVNAVVMSCLPMNLKTAVSFGIAMNVNLI